MRRFIKIVIFLLECNLCVCSIIHNTLKHIFSDEECWTFLASFKYQILVFTDNFQFSRAETFRMSAMQLQIYLRVLAHLLSDLFFIFWWLSLISSQEMCEWMNWCKTPTLAGPPHTVPHPASTSHSQIISETEFDSVCLPHREAVARNIRNTVVLWSAGLQIFLQTFSINLRLTWRWQDDSPSQSRITYIGW